MSGDCGHGWGYHFDGPGGPCFKCEGRPDPRTPISEKPATAEAIGFVNPYTGIGTANGANACLPADRSDKPRLTREEVEMFRREYIINAHVGQTPEQGIEPWAIEQNRVLNALCDAYYARSATPATHPAVKALSYALTLLEVEGNYEKALQYLRAACDRHHECSANIQEGHCTVCGAEARSDSRGSDRAKG